MGGHISGCYGCGEDVYVSGGGGRMKGRRRALEVGSSSVAGSCDGGCRVASSRGAGAEVESIRPTGAQSRPVSFRVSRALNTEKHLWPAAQDGIWLADGSGRGSAISEVPTTDRKTSTRLTRQSFSKLTSEGLSPRGRRLPNTPDTCRPLQNTC